MLINVFGTWLNPRLITHLSVHLETVYKDGVTKGHDISDFKVVDAGTEVYFCWGANDLGGYFVVIDNKTPDEVAAEINGQIKEGE